MRIFTIAAMALPAILLTNGCWWRRSKAPPPPAVLRTPPPEPPQLIVVAAPVFDASMPVSQLPLPPNQLPLAEPAPPGAAPAASRVVRTAPAQPGPTPPAEPAVEPAVPRLVQLLTPAEQGRHNKEIDEFIRQTEESLLRVRDERRLNAQQIKDVQRARAFLQQAQELRSSDLVTSRSLAQRAAVLADSVARTIR